MAQRPDVKIPFYLVTGFLGSGKTTLLKNFLRQYAGTQRLAIVQNEFSAMDVDGRELQRTGHSFALLEVNNGSVFCACLLGSFITSLANFVQTVQPQAVLVEATGLADPINLAQLLQAPELADKLYLAHIWNVVDAATFLQLEKQISRIQHQTRVADTILLNKTDLVAELAPLQTRLRELNPFAEILPTQFCQYDFTASTPSQFFSRQADGASAPRPEIQSAAIRSTRKIELAQLHHFLQLYEPQTLRIKGFVNLLDGTTLAVQSCFGKTELVPVSGYIAPTELVVIGKNLDAKAISRDFRNIP